MITQQFAPLPFDPQQYATGQQATGIMPQQSTPNLIQTDSTPVQMTAPQAFINAWMYDQTLTGMFNYISRPDEYNQKWVKNSKDRAWRNAEHLLGTYSQDYKQYFDQRVNSPQDYKHFVRTAINKESSRAAFSNHALAALASTVVDPVNFVGGGVAKLPQAVRIAQNVNRMGTTARTMAYGTFGTISGAAATLPNYLGNYDDPSDVATGALLGGSIFSILGKARGKDYQHYSREILKPVNIDNNKSFFKAVDKLKISPQKKKAIKNVYSKYLSLSDQVQMLNPQFSRQLLALGARGSQQSMRTATSQAGTLYNMVDAQNIAKLQQNLRQIPGYFANGLWQNAKAAILGRESQGLLSAKDIQAFNREAMGYMASKYNWQSTIDYLRISQEEFVKLAKKVDPDAARRFKPMQLDPETSNRYAVQMHVKSLRQSINQLNKKIPSYNAKMGVQASQSGAEFQPIKKMDFDGTLMNVRNPSLEQIQPVSRQIVKAYQDSGVAKALNRILRQKGKYYTASDNYTHLHIDHYRIDDMAMAHVPNVKQRAQNAIPRLQDQIWRKQESLSTNVVDQAKTIQELKGLKSQLRMWRQVASNDHAALMRAYDQLAADYGYQLYKAISKNHPQRFKQTGASAVGYLLMMRRLKPGAGHLALKQAWQNTQKKMSQQGMRQIIDDIVAYDDEFLQDVTQAMDGDFKLLEYIKKATNERRLNTSSIVGESNLFKRRFREDLMKPGQYTGHRPLDFLNANLYKTAQSMVQQTTARASLMGRTLDIKDQAGKVVRTVDLGTPQGLQAAVDNLADQARKAGYDDDQRNALADAVMNTLLGRPVGQQMSPFLQVFNALGTMSMLKNSGIYQFVEQANLNVQFGHLNVARAMAPAFKMGLSFGALTKNDDGTLKYMIAKTMAAEGRIRPSIERVGEDVQDIANSALAQTTQYAAQYTKFLNGGEFVRLWQNNQAAIICQSMLFDSLKKGKAVGRIAELFTQDQFQKFLKQYKQYGTKFSKWDNSVKELINRGFTQQIGNVVLSLRRGERPRLLMTNTGRWIFAFQSFVWGAHNKLLRRYMNDGNMLKLTHLILTQMAGAVAAVYATQMLKGKDPSQMDPMQVATKLGPSMSALGLIGTLWTSIDRGQIGGTIPALGFITNVGRGVKGITQGNLTDMYNTLPLASVFLPMRAVVAATQQLSDQ